VRADAGLKSSRFVLVGRQHLPKKYAKQADRWTYPAGLFLTCLGVKADLGKLGMEACNYWIADDYDFDAAYRRGAEAASYMPLGAYITSASLKDPDTAGHAPEGVHSLEVMTLFPAQPEFWGSDGSNAEAWNYKSDGQYSDRKAAIEENLIDRLEGLFPGTKEHICFRESATPLSHIRFTRATEGTGYGISVTPDQFRDRRPHPRSPVRGLYVCGASTRGTFGIMGTMLGGGDAARRIGEDLKKR
jgi:phytoene dehydrogenase-like protein